MAGTVFICETSTSSQRPPIWSMVPRSSGVMVSAVHATKSGEMCSPACENACLHSCQSAFSRASTAACRLLSLSKSRNAQMGSWSPALLVSWSPPFGLGKAADALARNAKEMAGVSFSIGATYLLLCIRIPRKFLLADNFPTARI